MRPQSFVRRREFDELRHRMRAFGNPGGVTHRRSVTLVFPATNMSFYASPDLAVVLGHFGAANRGQLPPGSHAAVGSTPAALRPCARRGRGIADHQTVAISFGIWMAKRGKPLQMGETAREKRLERLIEISSSCHL